MSNTIKTKVNRVIAIAITLSLVFLTNMAMSFSSNNSKSAPKTSKNQQKIGITILPDSPRPKIGITILPDSPRPKIGITILPDSPRP